MKSNRKIVCFVLAVYLLILLTGCAPKVTTTSPATSPATSPETAATTTKAPADTTAEEPAVEIEYDGTAPIFDEPLTITWVASNTGVATGGTDFANMVRCQEIIKKANVNIEMELLDSSVYGDAMMPRLAAGVDLPDVIMLPTQDTDLSFINAGLFYDLTEFYDDYAYNLDWRFEDNPTVKGQITTPDGQIFIVPVINMSTDYIPCYFFNRPWLESLDLSVPTTMDEFYELLKVFSENDINDNGDPNDEVPFTITGAGYFNMTGAAWGLDLPRGYKANNGVVECSYITDRYKDFLLYWNKLYKEKLIDNEFLSLSTDELYTKISNDRVGSTFHYPNFASSFANLVYENFDPESDKVPFVPTLPMKGPFGDHYYLGNDPVAAVFAINAQAENAKEIFWFLDWLYSEEANNLLYYGREDFEYDIVDGEIVPRLDVILSTPTFAADQGSNFGGFPRILLGEHRDKTQPKEVAAYNEASKPFNKLPVLWTYNLPDEIEISQTYSVDLSTYWSEMKSKFITGELDIEAEFDNYLTRMDELNVDAMVEVQQALYDRINK